MRLFLILALLLPACGTDSTPAGDAGQDADAQGGDDGNPWEEFATRYPNCVRACEDWTAWCDDVCPERCLMDCSLRDCAVYLVNHKDCDEDDCATSASQAIEYPDNCIYASEFRWRCNPNSYTGCVP